MALLDEIEPPSQYCESEQTKNLKPQLTKSKNHHYIIEHLRFFLTRASFASVFSTPKKLSPAFATGRSQVRNFVFNSKYLPHFALLCLGAIVAVSNINERITAAAYYKTIVSTGPDSESAITENLDAFTPIIPADSLAVQKVILASASADGFVSNTGSVATNLTSRETPLPDNSSSQVEYVIKPGDTLTSLGWKFEVKLSTLKYVNDIDDVDSIRPGLKIKVPVKGYEVSASLIAKKEKERQAKLAADSKNTARGSLTGRAYASGSIKVNRTPGRSANGYPYGYCTYYVATKRYVPSSWGDAKAWLGSAQRAGYSTGGTPAPGAIVVTRESWWGHVAYVESVNGNEITISEMNARGWGVTSRRTIPANGGVVRGYIY